MRTKAPILYRTAFVLILLLISLTCCLPVPIPKGHVNTSYTVIDVDGEIPRTTFPWLVDGRTTKEEVMGNENFRDVNPKILSQGKILVYCIDLDAQKICHNQLVLVFDEKDIVKRHSTLGFRER